MVTVGVKAIFGNFSMLIEACVCVWGGGVSAMQVGEYHLSTSKRELNRLTRHTKIFFEYGI